MTVELEETISLPARENTLLAAEPMVSPLLEASDPGRKNDTVLSFSE